jgi:DNA-binding NarL/FixJ family response regulator
MTFRHARPAKHASSRKNDPLEQYRSILGGAKKKSCGDAPAAHFGMAVGANRSAKIRILVADEHPLLREGANRLINRQPDMVVCGNADSIPTVQNTLTGCKPDLVLLGLRLGSGDTLEFIKALKAQYPELLILAFSPFDETIFAERTLRAGANGYLMNNATNEELLTAIRDILSGGIYVSRKIAMLTFQKWLETPRQSRSQGNLTAIENLSDREMHVFQLLGSGLGTTKIAKALNLSVKTIASHRENIKRKLDLHSGRKLIERATKWVEENLRPTQKDAVPAIGKKKLVRFPAVLMTPRRLQHLL